MDVPQLCRPLPIICGGSVILFCPRPCVQHLPQAVLQPVIATFFLQMQETVKRILEMRPRLRTVFLRPYAVPVHFCQFMIRIGVALLCGASIQEERLHVILRHALPTAVKPRKGILRILMPCPRRLCQPPGRCPIVLPGAKAGGIHFPDAVLQVGAFPFLCFLFCPMESLQRFGIPFLRRILVGILPKAVRTHPAQVMHRQGIPCLRLLPKQGAGLCKVLHGIP